ncbi:MAG: hypothetical protein ABIT68_11175, partial [Sphingomicrobium sp.]
MPAYLLGGTMMSTKSFRALTLGLLASTAFSTTAFAQVTPASDSPAQGTKVTDGTAPPAAVQQAQDGEGVDQSEIVITATKREENLQNVPISVQAIGTRRLDQ